MLRFKMLKESENRITYEYYPESGTDSGIVSVEKTSGECDVETLAVNDRHRIYALKLFSRLRAFSRDGNFKKEGIIAWY